MLIDFEQGGRTVTKVGGEPNYSRWKGSTPATDIATAKQEIHRNLDTGDFVVSSFIPGDPDWDGTPFAPLYWKGTKRDPVAAAMFLGLLVKECVLERDEDWGTTYHEIPGRDVKPRCYFRLNAAKRRA